MPAPFTVKAMGLARIARPIGINTIVASAAVTPVAARVIDKSMLIKSRFDLPIFRPRLPVTPGHDRGASTRPIADVVSPVDTTLFAAPDGSAPYYLPRYRLRQVAGNRYDIVVAPADEGGFRLTLGLDRFAPPELAATAGARELPHTVTALISYTAGSGLAKQIPLADLLLDDAGAVRGAAARLTLAERDSLLSALQREQSAARILIRRAISVSALMPATGGTAPAPTTLILHDALKPQLLQAIRVAPALTTINAARMKLPFEMIVATLATPAVVLAPPPPPAPRYHDVDLTLETAAEPDPLVLDPVLHAYFYGGAHVSSGAALKRFSIAYADGDDQRRYAYFQDGDDPTLFYYLPDAFRLGRQDDEPFTPEMVVRMTTPDGSVGSATTTIDYAARPFTLPDRLVAALPTLTDAMPEAARTAGTIPRLEPMPASAKLRLRVPGAAGVEMRGFDDVTVDLANGFSHSLTVPLDQFRQLFAAAFSTDATSLFTGEVLVTTGGASPEAVPVDIRFTETEGPLFDSLETPEADGTVSVKLRNATESPLRIRRLPIRLARGDASADGLIDGLDLSAPVIVAPGETAAFKVTPATPLAGDASTDAVFDFADVDIQATPDLVLPVISDSTVPAEYVRAVEVMTLPELLDADNPDGPILVINVEFKSGDPVRLSHDAQDVVAAVKLPLVNLLLGKDAGGSYAYRQQIIRRSGAQTQDTEWRESDFGMLVVPVTQ